MYFFFPFSFLFFFSNLFTCFVKFHGNYSLVVIVKNIFPDFLFINEEKIAADHVIWRRDVKSLNKFFRQGLFHIYFYILPFTLSNKLVVTY